MKICEIVERIINFQASLRQISQEIFCTERNDVVKNANILFLSRS